MIYDLQKASMWKRISAWMFDAILLGVAAVLFALLLSSALGFDRQIEALDSAYARYGEAYGVNFDLSLGEYDALTQTQRDTLNDAYAALNQDSNAVGAYNAVICMALSIVSLAILIAYAALEFFIPLRLGDGQTLGKKIFGIGLMQQNGVRLRTRSLFVRTFLGKYTFETMVPALIIIAIYLGILGLVGTMVLLGLLALECILLIATRERQTIHDAMAATVAIDVGSQMIFPDEDAMVAYIEKVHAEKAAQDTY